MKCSDLSEDLKYFFLAQYGGKTFLRLSFQHLEKMPLFPENVRAVDEITSIISLAFEPVFCVASMGTDNKYSPIDASLQQIRIRRNLMELISSTTLSFLLSFDLWIKDR